MKAVRKNNRGFTLVELIVAAGILSGLSLVVAQLGQQGAQVQKNVEVRIDEARMVTDVMAILANKDKCSSASYGLKGKSVKAQNITNLGFSSSKLIKNLDYGKVKFVDIDLDSSNAVSSGDTGIITGRLNYTRDGTSRSKSISVVVSATTANYVSECYTDADNSADNGAKIACTSLGGTWNSSTDLCENIDPSTNNAVAFSNTLSVTGTSTLGVVNSGALTSSGAVSGTSLSVNGTPVINSSNQFIGSGGINTSGAITTSSDITAGSLDVGTGAITTGSINASGTVSAQKFSITGTPSADSDAINKGYVDNNFLGVGATLTATQKATIFSDLIANASDKTLINAIKEDTCASSSVTGLGSDVTGVFSGGLCTYSFDSLKGTSSNPIIPGISSDTASASASYETSDNGISYLTSSIGLTRGMYSDTSLNAIVLGLGSNQQLVLGKNNIIFSRDSYSYIETYDHDGDNRNKLAIRYLNKEKSKATGFGITYNSVKAEVEGTQTMYMSETSTNFKNDLQVDGNSVLSGCSFENVSESWTSTYDVEGSCSSSTAKAVGGSCIYTSSGAGFNGCQYSGNTMSCRYTTNITDHSRVSCQVLCCESGI